MKESQQEDTFYKWMSKYRALIFKIVRAYTNNKNDQEDLIQDISLQIYRSIQTFKQESAVSTWIYRIALNTAIKWSSSRKKYTSSEEMHLITNNLETNADHQKDQLSWLYTEIKLLNAIDRSLMLLLLDGYAYKEMAEILGISESNIGVKIYRLKKQFTKKAKNYEYNEI